VKNKIIITIILTTSTLLTQAQKINDIQLLKSELDTISQQKLTVNSVAVNQNGNWIILYGDIGYSFTQMPQKLSEKLETLNKKQIPLKDIDFIGKSGWLLLAAENAFYSDSLPEKFLNALKQVNKQGQTITCADTYKNKTLLLFGKNKYYKQNIPETLKKKIINLQYRNQYIKNAALTKNDGWALLYATKGFTYKNIPVATAEKMKELVQNGSSLDKIFFLPDNKWIIIYDKYKYASNL